MNNLKRAFIAGLIFIIPISLSVWILFKTIVFFENILGAFLKKNMPVFYTPGIGIFLLILLILFIGFLADNLLGKKILSIFEKVFETIPLLNKIYIFIKGISQSIFQGKTNIFKEPVVIEFFTGTYTLGFITGISYMPGYISVFVPTVPNISTGFYLMVPEHKIEKLNISVEEALQTIVSMGICGPTNGSYKNSSDSPEKK